MVLLPIIQHNHIHIHIKYKITQTYTHTPTHEAKIYCPTHKDSRCDIKCLNKNSCYLTEIYGDEYNLINIDCFI